MTVYKQPVSVLVVIHTPDTQVLLLERAKHPGYWQSVTGSREGEEMPILTACREVGEETGFVIAPDDLKDWHMTNEYEIFPEWRHRYAPGVTRNTEHVFSLCLSAPVAPTLAVDEHRAWRWLPRQQGAEACFSWSNREAILAL